MQSTATPIDQAGRETGTEAVSQPPPMNYRQIGQALADHIKQSSGVPTGAALQGMIADLAADQPELLLPMRDLVSRPAFRALLTKADSGSGMLQRDALINEVRPLYSGQVLEALSELLNGFLNLQSSTNQNQTPPGRQEWNEQHQSPHQVIANATVATAVVASSTQAKTADDFRTEVEALLAKKGNEQEVIRLLNQALAIHQSGKAYFYRGIAKAALGDKEGSITDCNQAMAINPYDADTYNNRGNSKYDLGDKKGAIADYNQAIAINPQKALSFYNRGNAKSALGDKHGAIADYNQAISINPQYAKVYNNRANAKLHLNDREGACRDYKKAVSLGETSTSQWLQTKNGAWCRDMP